MTKICNRCETNVVTIEENKDNEEYYCPECTATLDSSNIREAGKKKKSGLIPGSIIINWGKYNGFYYYSDGFKKIGLGKFAITYLPKDIDETFKKLAQEMTILAQEERIDQVIEILEESKEEIRKNNIDGNKYLSLRIRDSEDEK